MELAVLGYCCPEAMLEDANEDQPGRSLMGTDRNRSAHPRHSRSWRRQKVPTDRVLIDDSMTYDRRDK